MKKKEKRIDNVVFYFGLIALVSAIIGTIAISNS
jgi:hypothetical protein